LFNLAQPVAGLVSDRIPFLTGHIPVANVFDSREPVFAKAADFLPRTQTETPTPDGRGSLESSVVVLSVRLEKRSGDRQAGHPDRLVGLHGRV
jgi:hypothetical protein